MYTTEKFLKNKKKTIIFYVIHFRKFLHFKYVLIIFYYI